MKWKTRFTLFALLLWGGAAGAGGGQLNKAQFAWGLELLTPPGKALYRLSLPPQVYDGVVSAELADLAVFNGNGDPVPHQLSLRPAVQKHAARRHPAALFPLYGPEQVSLQALSLQLTRPLVQGELKLRAHTTRPTHREVLRGHILRLREADQKQRVAALELDWKGDTGGFVQRLRVEQSDDLNHWRLIKGDAVVADLQHGGERLRRHRIELGGIAGRYLRLSPLTPEKAVDFTQATVELVPENQPTRSEQRWLESVRRGTQAGEFLFELPLALPISQLDVIPAEQNSFARVVLFSRQGPEAKWVQRTSGLIYNLLADGAVLQQTALKPGSAPARQWRLVVDMNGGGLGNAIPQISASWRPHELLFAARGTGPFTLAYGSARVGASGNPPALKLDAKGSRALTGVAHAAGEPVVLGGRDLLRPKTEVEWKQALLWGVLILASLLLVGMGWSLLRKVGRASDGE